MEAKTFWTDFKKSYFEKKPVVFKKNAPFLPLPRLSDPALFQEFVRMIDDNRSKEYVHDDAIKLFLNQRQRKLGSDIEHIFPKVQDGSFEGYNNRLLKIKNLEEYCWILEGLHRFDRNFFRSICEFVRPMFTVLGIPKKQIEVNLFIGNYKRTPFGVHVDRASIFHMPVVGTKKMRTWKAEYVRKNPELRHAKEYKKHLKNSVLLKAEPGGFMYWPSNRWHTGESTGTFSVTWGFGFWFGDIADDHLKKTFDQQWDVKLKSKTGLETVRYLGEDLVRTAQNQVILARNEIRKIKEIVNDENFGRSNDIEWLKYVSAYGFCNPPRPRQQQKLTSGDTIKIDSLFPLVSLVRDRHECIIACRGYSCQIPQGKWVPSLLRKLNAGRSVSVRELVIQFADSAGSSTKVMNVLNEIQKIGGFEKRAL